MGCFFCFRLRGARFSIQKVPTSYLIEYDLIQSIPGPSTATLLELTQHDYHAVSSTVLNKMLKCLLFNNFACFITNEILFGLIVALIGF